MADSAAAIHKKRSVNMVFLLPVIAWTLRS